ncbi:MAG TPA: GNAT family N-acetyltransferase [Rudaea sp.]|nr:GNAT family N-acetyltransferase [Rudaea sp.]
MSDDETAFPIHVRLAHADDDEFVLSLATRFVDFELPAWRKRNETLNGIREDLARHLRELPAASHLFVAEDDEGERLGFLHLQTQTDFFTGALNCHISDIVTSPDCEGSGVGSELIAHAERWAKEHRCRHLTLSVFPGNERARGFYERRGFGTELLRMAKIVK